MAKYDWIALENEYILGDYKSIREFLKEKGISRGKSTTDKTKDWNDKKQSKVIQKSSKIAEKVIEKESEKEANEIVNINSIADELAKKVLESIEELNKHIAKKTNKSKIVEYDYKTNKPKKEVIEEIEEILDYESVIDRKGLNLLAGALKDINDIKNTNSSKGNEEKAISDIQNLMVKIKEVSNADTD